MGQDVVVSLDDQLASFVAAQVSFGHYGDAAAVMRAALRLLVNYEGKCDALRDALKEGEESGVSERDVMDIWAEVQAEAEGAKRG